ncbi:hypothetical protein V3C99_004391 [Haemonchus contortus]
MSIPPPGVVPPMIFGGQPPFFGSVGANMPCNPVINISGPGPSTANSDVGYDTNSKDPVLTRSRVFIGRLAGFPIIRDDLINLCKPFGTVLGLNHFKQGFAFVQFSMSTEADAAVIGLNGKKWMGTILDVHLVDPQAPKKPVEQQESAPRKRAREEDECRAATEEDIKEANRRNRIVALSDSTTNNDLSHAEIPDTMICGSCRFVTADYEAFKDHRIAGCTKDKSKSEPKHLKCASCDNRFKSAWGLLCHLTEFHRMMLYKTDEETEQSTNKESGARPKSGPEPSEKPREAAHEPILQQPRTQQSKDTMQSSSYGPVFPTDFATPRKSESWRSKADPKASSSHYNNGSVNKVKQHIVK